MTARQITISRLSRTAAPWLFRLIMALLWPLRWLGIFGTRRRPRRFDAGTPIPFWLELYTWPRHARLDFLLSVAVWFDMRSGEMVVQAAEPGQPIALFQPRPENATIRHARIVGAPTRWYYFDGKTFDEAARDIAPREEALAHI